MHPGFKLTLYFLIISLALASCVSRFTLLKRKYTGGYYISQSASAGQTKSNLFQNKPVKAKVEKQPKVYGTNQLVSACEFPAELAGVHPELIERTLSVPNRKQQKPKHNRVNLNRIHNDFKPKPLIKSINERLPGKADKWDDLAKGVLLFVLWFVVAIVFILLLVLFIAGIGMPWVLYALIILGIPILIGLGLWIWFNIEEMMDKRRSRKK